MGQGYVPLPGDTGTPSSGSSTETRAVVPTRKSSLASPIAVSTANAFVRYGPRRVPSRVTQHCAERHGTKYSGA